MLGRLWVILLAFYIPCTLASQEVYPFEQQTHQKRFEQLIKDYRCVTCQNQNLADSNAPIAESMRDAIYNKILSGQTDQDIQDFLVERYGEFVLYKPPFKAETTLLWFGPLLFLMVALGFAARSIKLSSSK